MESRKLKLTINLLKPRISSTGFSWYNSKTKEMKAKEKKETIEVLEKYIKFIENHLKEDDNFLCYMDTNISKTTLTGGFINCGFNNRMLPNAIEYVESQRPTIKINRVIYDKPCFKRHNSGKNDVWWNYNSEDKYDIIVNTEKIDFLKHLINKLKK